MPVSVRRFLVALDMNHRQYVRRRLNLILLVAVPAFFVALAFYVFPQELAILRIRENGILLTLFTTRRSYGGVFQALEAATTLAGLTGVFMVLNAMKADRRLALCGFRPFELVGARIVQLIGAAIFVSFIATAATAAQFWAGRADLVDPAPSTAGLVPRELRHDAMFARLGQMNVEVTHVAMTGPRFMAVWIAVSLGACIYAALGVFVGSLVRRPMEGSYLMFALPVTDVIVLNMPILSRALDTWWVVLTPAYHPARLLEAAAFAEVFPMANLRGGLSMLLAASMLAMFAFRRLVRP